jgi:ketosteroid isomerase-like protein
VAHPNEELIRKGYAAFDQRDMAALNDLFADDVTWHVTGDNPLAGDYEGKEAVFGLFAKLAEETGGSLRNDIHDVLANDEHGVALVTARAERGGKTLSDNAAHVLHIEGGKVTEFWIHSGDQQAVDQFWS